ncbi:MAG: ATP-binding protein [Chlamydiia bacterium]
MDRIYDSFFETNLRRYRQMAFVTGPRQVGKTTTGQHLLERFGGGTYLNWDIPSQRLVLLEGVDGIERAANLEVIGDHPPLIILDELHKFAHWKDLLKGLYDHLSHRAKILVTGSARLDVFNRGGDSLMGRYFLYRYHPLSVGEIASAQMIEEPLRSKPVAIPDADYEALLRFGGYPDPYLQRSDEFLQRWQSLRFKQLLQDEVRDLTKIQQIAQLEVLGELLRHQAGQSTSYESLAKKVRISANTIRSWVQTLEALYYCFTIRPWSKNVTRSLLKEPKIYLWDWTLVLDEGSRRENVIASHLLKACHFWSDCGWGAFELYYLRDKDQREIDFLIAKDNEPWMMVEAKSQQRSIGESFHKFYEQLRPTYAVQVVFDLPYTSMNTLIPGELNVVPARSFLSQLP